MTATPLKYQQQLAQKSCGFTQFKEYPKRTAYRWTFADIADPRNFLPIYALDHQRLKDDQDNGKYSCTCWALSFFETKKQAKRRLEELMVNRPMIYKKLGTHAAKGVLSSTDGISGDCDNLGHYNHFEYANVQLQTKFVIEECFVEVNNG